VPTTQQRVPEIDLMALGDMPDPYGVLAEVREMSPLVRTPLGAWGVTRHEDVSALLRDKRLGHEFPREYMTFVFGAGPLVDAQLNMLLNRDAPDHTRLRKLMSRAFSGIVVRKLQDHVRDLVDELLDAALERGSMDVVSELAYPLPIRMICELLGIDRVDRDEVRRNVDGLIGRDFPAAHRSAGWLRDYIGSVLTDRRPDPDGDLLARMLAAEDGEDAFTHDEMVDNALLVFFAGFETVRGLISNGIHALLEHPDEWRRLRADPSLAPLAVEEFLRYDTPVPAVNRITLEPVEIGGRTIKAKHWVILLLNSANRDPSAFADPDRLDIGRKPNPHVGFGGGIHHCMGAMLARLEGEVVFGRLAERVATLEAAGLPRRYHGSRSFAELPVFLTRADASPRPAVYVS
jgi:cytochrome P450